MQHELLGVQAETLLTLYDPSEPAESDSKQNSNYRKLSENIRHTNDRSQFQLVYAYKIAASKHKAHEEDEKRVN